MQIQILKWVDSTVGGFLAGILPAARAGVAVVPRRILLIRPGGIGDAVLLVPAILALKQRLPEAEISVLAERRNGHIFALCPAVDHLLLYDKASELFKAIRGGYDLVIDTEQWYRLSAVLARLTGAKTLIGFGTNERKRLFTHPVSYAQDQYEAHSFFRLLEPLGIQVPSRIETPFLELPSAACEAADKLLAPLSGSPFVTVFAGASLPQKQWGAENFRELILQLEARGIAVLLVGGADERRGAEDTARGSRALDLTGRSSLAVTAALIGKGRVLVSGDSGVLHIAAGLGTPTVSLFGPSDPGKWAPQGESDLVFDSGLPCAPCSRFGTISSCADAGRCLSGIKVAEVLAAVEKLLGG